MACYQFGGIKQKLINHYFNILYKMARSMQAGEWTAIHTSKSTVILYPYPTQCTICLVHEAIKLFEFEFEPIVVDHPPEGATQGDGGLREPGM